MNTLGDRDAPGIAPCTGNAGNNEAARTGVQAADHKKIEMKVCER